jgi:hypothetical protein
MTKTDSYSQGFSNPAGLSRTEGGLITQRKSTLRHFYLRKANHTNMITRDTKTKDSINKKRISVFKGRVCPQPIRDFPLSISILNMKVSCYSSSGPYTQINYRPILSLGCFNKQCPHPYPLHICLPRPISARILAPGGAPRQHYLKKPRESLRLSNQSS